MIGNKNNKAKSKKNLYTLVIENMTKRSAQASLMITCDISKEENMSESIRRNSSHLTRLRVWTLPLRTGTISQIKQWTLHLKGQVEDPKLKKASI